MAPIRPASQVVKTLIVAAKIMIGRGASLWLKGLARVFPCLKQSRRRRPMNWVQFVTIWKRLKGKIALHRVRIADDRKIAETLKSAQTSDDRRPPFRPDNREKRHEFSQYISS
jgi:hypothetical protein